MPDRDTNKGRRDAFPWGLLGAFVLAGLIETWVVRHALDVTPTGVAGFQFAARASRSVRGDDLLFFGDSLIKHGVVPRVIEAKLGRKAYNLATVGGLAPLTHDLTRRVLDSGVKPALIVVDFKSTQLSVDPRAQDRALAEVLTPVESFDLARLARDVTLFGRLMAYQAVPSLRARLELRSWAISALAGKPESTRQVVQTWERNWHVNRGAGLLPRSPTPGVHADASVYDAMGRWSGHPLNMVSLQRFLNLTAARNIPVVWLVPPIAPNAQSRRDWLGLDAAYNRLLRRSVASFPHLHVIDARQAEMAPEHFFDVSHLDVEGALAFSDRLADALRPLLDAPRTADRWSVLPPTTLQVVNVPHEDATESARALAGDSGTHAHAIRTPGASRVVR